MSTVLVVDDKEMMRDSVGATLRRAGFEVSVADGGADALETIARRRPDAIVTDLKMPGMTGLELLEKIREIDDDLPVVVMTAFGTIESAVTAMKLGAFDYVTKPFEGDELIISVKRGLSHAKLARENAVLRAGGVEAMGASGVPAAESDGGGPGRRGLDRLIGESPAMRRVKDQVRAVAGSHGTVLITGESGTGKEVVARAVHDLSPRSASPFLGVNCAALSESLLESELFGHERGAFTGADKLRKGRFELSDGGTLLLDEVSEVSSPVQAKLLRVLQERAFERVGSSLTIGVDVRVLATSNRDLPEAASRGDFRQDLFFRLNVLPIHLPPLREREGDAVALAEHFVAQISRREGRPPLGFDEGARSLLSEYHWPGNVRELQNICERAVVLTAAVGSGAGVIAQEMIEPWLGAGPEVSPEAAASPAAHGSKSPHDAHAAMHTGEPMSDIYVPRGINGDANGFNGSARNGNGNGLAPDALVVSEGPGEIRPLAVVEREVIVRTLERFGGHRQKTAKALGIGVRTLGLKLKKWKEEHLVPEEL